MDAALAALFTGIAAIIVAAITTYGLIRTSRSKSNAEVLPAKIDGIEEAWERVVRNYERQLSASRLRELALQERVDYCNEHHH